MKKTVFSLCGLLFWAGMAMGATAPSDSLETQCSSISVINKKQIEERTLTNITKLLEGSVPGIFFLTGSGEPGSDAELAIRELPTKEGNRPVFVVDGFVYNGPLSLINLNDVERVNVLKDAAACAKYGMYGKNGVIEIVTKKGSSIGKPVTINFKGRWGVASEEMSRYNTMSEANYLETHFQYFKNQEIFDRGTPVDFAGTKALLHLSSFLGAQEKYNPYNLPVARLIDPVTGKINPEAQLKYHDNWMDEIMNNAPFRQDYNIDVMGQWSKVDMRVSMGYLSEDGLIRTTDFKRYTGQVQANAALLQWLKIGGNINLAKAISHYLDKQQLKNIALTAPILPVYQRDLISGALLLDEQGNKQYDYYPDYYKYNPIERLCDNTKQQQTLENFKGQAYLSLNTDSLSNELFRGFTLISKLGWTQQTIDTTANSNTYFASSTMTSKFLHKIWNFNQQLNYTRNIRNHNISLTLGYEHTMTEGTHTMTDISLLPDYPQSLIPENGYSFQYEKKVNALFTTLNYNFQQKYYFDATYRKDNYTVSQLKDPLSTSYWSLAAAWEAKNENFMSTVNWLSKLNFNISIGAYADDMPVLLFAPNNMFNAKYGVSDPFYSFNTGMKLGLFNRVLLQVDYYHKTTKTDCIVPDRSFPYSIDAVKVEYQGLELSLSALIIKSRTFSWQLTAMGQTMNNTVVETWWRSPSSMTIYEFPFVVAKGQPLGSFYMPKFREITPFTGAAVLSEDAQLCGTVSPDLIGSFTNRFTLYENLALAIQCNYAVGGKVFDAAYAEMLPVNGFIYNTIHQDLLKAWTQPADRTVIPRLGSDPGWTKSDFSLRDASYFSIKYITLSYAFPKTLVNKMRLTSLSLSVSAENVAFFSTRSGLNPIGSFGVATFAYPIARTISLGLDLCW